MPETSGNAAVSYGSPSDHVACDTAIAGLRATLAEMAQCITTFLAVRGEHAEAADLAEGLRQILGRQEIRSEEEGS